MTKKNGQIVISFSFLLALVVSLYGCTFMLQGSPTKQKLPSYYDEESVVAARFFTRTSDEPPILEELPQEKLTALTEKLNRMELTYHAFHTDYFWGGQFGIELERQDGTFLTYDGTLLSLRKRSVKDGYATEDTLKCTFLEVTNCDFWKEMESLFPSVKDAHLLG